MKTNVKVDTSLPLNGNWKKPKVTHMAISITNMADSHLLCDSADVPLNQTAARENG